LAHGGAVRIRLFVAVPDAVPAARDSAGPGKGELRRAPVGGEKTVNVAAVPSGLLPAQRRGDSHSAGFIASRRSNNRREKKKRSKKEQKFSISKHKFSGHSVFLILPLDVAKYSSDFIIIVLTEI
jgi:hypothetical protein